MTYSCCDFTDDILDTLNITVPDALCDSPSDQADLAIAEIERLQAIATKYAELVDKFPAFEASVHRTASAAKALLAEIAMAEVAPAGVLICADNLRKAL